jgi:excisionase family DNA binding protein
MNNLIDCKGLSQLLDVKEWTIRHWVSEKKIPFIKVGRLVRFDEEQIRKFIEKNSVDEHEYYRAGLR